MGKVSTTQSVSVMGGAQPLCPSFTFIGRGGEDPGCPAPDWHRVYPSSPNSVAPPLAWNGVTFQRKALLLFFGLGLSFPVCSWRAKVSPTSPPPHSAVLSNHPQGARGEQSVAPKLLRIERKVVCVCLLPWPTHCALRGSQRVLSLGGRNGGQRKRIQAGFQPRQQRRRRGAGLIC